MLVVDSPAMAGKDAVCVGDWPSAPKQPTIADCFDPNRDKAAEAAQTLHLKGWGYAPGDYFINCIDCAGQHIADKRAWRCATCAQKRFVDHESTERQDDAYLVQGTLGANASDADVLAAVMAPGAKVVPHDKDHYRTLFDNALPDFVRAYVAMNQGPATETMAIRAAGMMPALYATWTPPPGTIYSPEGPIRVRVTTVSRLGDVGISRKDEEFGYFTRLSIFDLTEFDTEMHPEAPARRKSPVRQFALADKDDNWVRINPKGSLTPFAKSSVPILYPTAKAAYGAYMDIDRHGLLGLQTIPVNISRGKDQT